MPRTTRQLFVSIFTCLTYLAHGQTQTNEIESEDSVEVFIFEEKMPIPPGGYENLNKIIADSLKYPISAFQDRIGGEVVTRFVIDTNGNVRDIIIVKGIREDLDSEAIRIVGLLNGWTPATQAGKKVEVKYTLPLIFYPDDRWKRKYKRKEHRQN